MTTYRISDVADELGVPATTLRYYEDIGLVAAPARTDNGYRSYEDRDLDRLRFITRAKALRLTLDDLRELVGAWDTDDCSAVQHRMAEVVAVRLTETQDQIANLVDLAAHLQAVARRLRAAPAAGPCGDDCPCVAQADSMPAPLPLTGRPLTDNAEAVPIACSLDAGGMQDRLADWRSLLERAVAREAVEGGIRLQFSADPDVGAALGRLAVAEQQCCSFFDFRLRVAALLEFEVRTPPEAGDFLTTLFGPPSSHALARPSLASSRHRCGRAPRRL